MTQVIKFSHFSDTYRIIYTYSLTSQHIKTYNIEIYSF